MNRALKRISIAVLVMFLALMVNINYLQGFETASLATRPGNSRALAAQNLNQRGDIVTADGVKIAGTKPSNDPFHFQRYYVDGQVYAPVTGFFGVNGSSGVEATKNSLLTGNDSSLSFRNFIDMITNKPRKGATVQVTINSKAQQAAYAGLQSILQGTGHVGGVVAINPRTGAILAMASWPSYDTNRLASHDGPTFNANDNKLINQNPSPLLNNATQSAFPPGSTFKVVTTSAWYASNSANNPNTLLDSPQPLKLPNTNFLSNDNNEQCGNGSGKTPAIQAFAQSCNTPFAALGISLGGDTLKSMANGYGFNQALSIPGVTAATSNFTAEADKSFTAFDAIGQHDTTVTALQEAMIAATVANNGTLMKPYLVQQVTASDLSIVSQASPQTMGQPISSTVAGFEKQMMVQVVQNGTAAGAVANAGAQNLNIAGKTGTAQNGVAGASRADAVFTAFAPADNPTVAVG
ncbi:MAG TPA: penicillin-binding transpeptidase domain-containing protein, partial [Streptosporangiaceae bacterium]